MAETLTLGQQIDIARIKSGMTQKEIVEAMVAAEIDITDTNFSLKKKYSSFPENEIKVLSKILKTKFTN